MKPMTRAIAVALIQILIVCSLGAKLLYDRRTRPRAWFKTERYDPDLPIRGRYLGLQVEVSDPRSPEELESKFANELAIQENQNRQYRTGQIFNFGDECGSIALHGDTPTAIFDGSQLWDCPNLRFSRRRTPNETVLRVNEPILFFISDTAKDPSRLPTRDELWVLATIPGKGPPRPIALGIKKSGGTSITPLSLN
jgi:hypothetical protein